MIEFTPTHGKILPNDRMPTDLVDAFKLRSRLVYSLPEALLRSIRNEKGIENVISDDSYDLESRLASKLSAFGIVGVRGESPVTFIRLAEVIQPFDRTMFASSADPDGVMAEASKVLQETHEWAQAYLGWLVQQAEFQSDVNGLRNLGCDRCLPLGTPPPYPVDSSNRFDLLFRPEHQTAVRDVCRKWRLDGFATLDLPIPLEPHFIASSPYNENARDGGAAPFIPDTFPVKGRGEVLDRLRATKPSTGVDHLQGWMELIAPDSKQAPRLFSLARQFRLQHYWRVVQYRYGDELSGKKTKLYPAFAKFLGENTETVRKELPKLKQVIEVPLSDWL